MDGVCFEEGLALAAADHIADIDGLRGLFEIPTRCDGHGVA